MNYEDKLKHPKWQKRRLEIMSRAEWKCEVCGDAESQLHVHHTRYQQGMEPWQYADAELKCLCETCHTLTHIAESKILAFLGEKAPKIRYVNEYRDAVTEVEEELARNDRGHEETISLLKYHTKLQKWKAAMPKFSDVNRDEPTPVQ